MGNRIKDLIIEKKLKQKDIASAIGVQASAVSQWVKGKTKVDPKHLPALARLLDVTVDYLLGEEPSSVSISTNSSNIGDFRANISELYTPIPYLSARAQAGISDMITDCQLNWIEETYPVLLSGVSANNKLIIDVIGDSMEPELHSGDKVLAQAIEKSKLRFKTGGVYAVLYAGNFIIKRIKNNDLSEKGTLTLWSDNERYGHITLQAEDITCVFEVLQFVYRPVR